MPRILNAEAKNYCDAARRILRSLGPLEEGQHDRGHLLSRLYDVEVLIVRLGHKVDRELLEAAPALRAVVSATTGLDHIDLDAARERGVEVLSLRGEVDFLESVVATPEHTWALLLSLIRRVPAAADAARTGHFDRDRFRGGELRGKRLGLVGLGRVGRRVARYALAFDMRVAAFDPEPLRPVDGVELKGSLDALLLSSDVVSLHPPLTASTLNMIGERELSLLPAGAYLVNTARGELVDENALARALEGGRLAGAALDVVHHERDPQRRLRGRLGDMLRSGRHNLLVTPHIAGATRESMAATEVFMARKLESWLASGGTSASASAPAEEAAP
ncbi:MAG: NAD(P)-dependent oxidoreductase [Acidobacteriota bacterium]